MLKLQKNSFRQLHRLEQRCEPENEPIHRLPTARETTGAEETRVERGTAAETRAMAGEGDA